MLTNPTAPQALNLQDYTYDLPEELIAKFPAPERDQARLLVYRRGDITHSRFVHLSEYIPADTLLVFNNTRVIPARLQFQKPSANGQPGALIEVLLLEPQEPSRLFSEAMQATGSGSWHCMIGNQKRWRPGTVLRRELSIGGRSVELSATLLNAEESLVQLSWPEAYTFAEIIRNCGEMPLPPYLKRKAVQADAEQYQTVYSKKEGAVAAPTAGLHFTPRVLDDLARRGVTTEFLTLHVGAGTFQPVKVQDVWQHPMHAEQMIFTEANLVRLIEKVPQVFAVGTTSMRALESLYWYGVKLLRNPNDTIFNIGKLYPYQFGGETLPEVREAFGAVLHSMRARQLTELTGETEIMIAPGYSFRVCKGLITNYHLPGTTLMLLVGAFIGEDWRRVYQEALDHQYRFLSYGDSSLLIP